MQRGLVGIAGAAVVSGVGFFVLKRITGLGLSLPDVVLAATVATLVLAAAGTGFAVLALVHARQARQEIARLARSVDAAMQAVKTAGDSRSISIGAPAADAALAEPAGHAAAAEAQAVQAKIIALAAALPGEKAAPNGRRH
ncbi:hypothetical protein [Kumtagia ephedrae]|jgi:hypothetical protein|uniref:Uncharacterized protein n=1 Tax=Kumtagia ephedrae TaxID=2116701 RepID=A0A2P7SF09_9HYPH|nr:hypothetical protein [Mesorhizobium ephedrae]PSJ61096.1 hypothetical protein C7I84_10380 [Mesorhizobium ephedrae]